MNARPSNHGEHVHAAVSLCASVPFLLDSAMIIQQPFLSVKQRKLLKRTTLSLTEKHMERLHQRADKEGVALSEVVRRAGDAFFAWDDPASPPSPSRPESKSHSSPPSKSGAFWLVHCKASNIRSDVIGNCVTRTPTAS